MIFFMPSDACMLLCVRLCAGAGAQNSITGLGVSETDKVHATEGQCAPARWVDEDWNCA